MAKRVAGYVRVSRVGSRAGDSFQSPEAQEDAIRAHCKARRLELVKVVHELDESGGTMQRPKLQRLIADVEAGTLAGLVVARLDRFARTLVGGIQALEAIDTAGGFVQTVEGGIDTSESAGAFGDFQRNLLLTFAQWQRATLAEGFEAAKARAVARGVHISGKVPVGYLRNGKGARLELDPGKAEAVRAAFELRASGADYGAVRRLLDDRLPGGPSGKGAWQRNTIVRMLGNPVYVGEARAGRHVHPDAHLPVVSRQVFDVVRALAHADATGVPRPASKSLLAGVVCCRSCGYALTRCRMGGTYLAYRCRARVVGWDCEAPTTVVADKLDVFVEDAVLAKIADRTLERVPARGNIDEIHGRVAAARARRLPFEHPGYVAVLGVQAATRALVRVDEEIAMLEGELANAVQGEDASSAALIDVAEVWPTLLAEERRQVIRAMVEAVHVSRAPRGTALDARVTITWKGDTAPVARPSRGRRKRPEVVAGMAAA